MGYLIAAIAALFVLSRGNLSIGGTFGSMFGSSSGPYVQPPQPTFVAPNPLVNQNQVNLSEANSAIQSGLGSVGSFVQAGTSLSKAIPIIGDAIGAIIGVFAQASAKRAAQAKNENAAVAQAVPGWDQMVAALVNAYNNGSISSSDVFTGLQAAWNNFWAEVGPQVQPGRNGCQSGTLPQFPTAPGRSFCTGDKNYGAGCCVAYDDLLNSSINMLNAVKIADNTGKPTPALILGVFASKYGGVNRPQYTVTFARPS